MSLEELEARMLQGSINSNELGGHGSIKSMQNHQQQQHQKQQQQQQQKSEDEASAFKKLVIYN